MSVLCDVYGITFCGLDELLDTDRSCCKTMRENTMLLDFGSSPTAMRLKRGEKHSGREVLGGQM
jgi:hypothetical protein